MTKRHPNSNSHRLQTRQIRRRQTPSVFLQKPTLVSLLTWIIRLGKKQLSMNFKVYSPTLQLDKKHKMLHAPYRCKTYKINALLDIGALQRALSESELRKVTIAQPEPVLREMRTPQFKIQITNGNLVEVKDRVVLRFFSSRTQFWQNPSHPTNNANGTDRDVFSKRTLRFWTLKSFSTPSRHQRKYAKKPNRKYLNSFIEVHTTQQTVIPPFKKVLVPVRAEIK